MSYSAGFKVNVNRLNAEEAILVLLEISHPFLSQTIRLVRDSKDFIFNGETYLAMPFLIKRQSDIQNELPKVNVQIPNVGRSLVKWIDSSGGGSGSKISVILARRSSNVEEEKISFEIDTVSVSSDIVNISLIVQNNFTKRSMRYVYSKERAPGLF